MLNTLKRYWGYDSFRPLQDAIVQSVLDGHDTLALLPTGGGKSITFQVPGMMLPGLTIVVTPLISLMKDQVDNLRTRGISATYLHSGLSRGEARLAFKKAELGKVKFLYVSPERLTNEAFMSRIRGFDVSLIVVDEAHCISQWGFDFRPSYLHISRLRDIFPQAGFIAVTASATARVVDDITTLLAFRPGFKIFRKSFARDNISYIVRIDEGKPERLLRVLRNTSGPAIVYARSRARTRELSDMLNAAGIPSDYYHAGLVPQDKEAKQERWKSGQRRVMVATNAFGMGIDKADVRTVVHYDLPSSIEEYYQEAGRAGRDGRPSYAVALVSRRDKATLSRRLNDSFPPKDYIRGIYDRACLFVDLAIGEGFNQTFDFNFGRFVHDNHLQEAPARAALRILSLAGYVDFVEDIDARARLIMVAEKRELYDMQLTDDEDQVLQYVLRTYPGVYADYVQIAEESISADLAMEGDRVYQAMLGLTRAHALHYVPRRQEPYLFFPGRRILSKHIELRPDVYDLRREMMKQRIEAVKEMFFNPEVCRANAILRYFGENPQRPCGTCDTCRSGSVRPTEEKLESHILSLPSVRLDRLSDKAIEVARRLMDEGKLKPSQISQ